MLQTRMALMPLEPEVLVEYTDIPYDPEVEVQYTDIPFSPEDNPETSNCYGEGCTGGSQTSYVQQIPVYETPHFIGGCVFMLLIALFVTFLTLRNRQKNKK